MHQYMINCCKGTDRCPMFRSEHLNSFRAAINRLKREEGLSNFNSRLIFREDVTIFSYSDPSGMKVWFTEPFYVKPIKSISPFTGEGKLVKIE